MRFSAVAIVLVMSLAACVAPPPVEGGKGRAKVYRISAQQAGKVQFGMLDSVNALRTAAGVTPMQLNSRLNAAAATHSRDMAVQNRPWHFGSDGSSPIDRVARTGYEGPLRGELISETYESEIETLAAWADQPDTRRVLMDPQATNMGFAWHQESNGKIWWTLVTGG